MKRFFTLLVLLLTASLQHAHAQKDIENTENTVIADSLAPKGVVIIGDDRLALLEKDANGSSTTNSNATTSNTGRPTTTRRGGSYNTRGFRVQIYSGTDRAKATKTKVDFIRRFPGTASYLQYVSPQFRVKVGNFKTRAEAYELYRQVTGTYSPCMVVPDNVTISY